MSQFPTDTGYQARQVQGRQTETVYGQGGAFAQVRPFTDPHQQAVATLLSFGQASHVVEGTVMDSTVLAHCYKVHVEKGRAPVLAMLGSSTSLTCSGARQLNTLTPGTRVVMMVHDKSCYGLILAVLPLRMTAANRSLVDQITSASRTRVDEMHKRPIKMVGNSTITDWLSGRPFDSIDGGEAGFITATGVRLTVDDYMLAAAVNEFCGIWGYYHDSLLRVTGYNLQMWNAGSEREAFDDEGETDDVQHYSPYVWEGKGVFNPGDDPRVSLSPEAYQLGSPWYAKWEPKSDRQQPFARDKHYHGYLGQGGRTLTIAPPPSPPEVWQYKPGPPGSATSAYTTGSGGGAGKPGDPAYSEVPPVGLHADNTALDGRRFIESAKGIVISKRMLIPDAARRKRPDSDDGDNKDNYKASGQFGSGPEHKITGDIKLTSNHPQLQRATAVLDLHAYLFNYSGLHPFHYHDKDYKTWEEQELQHADVDQIPPDFSKLRGSMYLEPPEAKRIKIDHRYKEQDFFQTESFISLLDDGGIVIGDGYGAEIRLSGGSIFLSAPGDIWHKAGRNIQEWAGRDLIMRAKGSLEGSTSEKSIRFKSEKDTMISAGNSGTGGVLIESRATSPVYDFTKIGDDVQFGGVVLRAPKSEVVALANQIYLRSGGTKEIEEGDITIDCARGKRNLVVNCDNHITFLEGGSFHFFGTDGEIETSNEFTRNFTGLCSLTGVVGDFAAIGSVINKGWILAAEGHIATEFAKQYSYFVAPLEGKGLQQVKEFLAEIEAAITSEYPAFGKEFWEYNPQTLWYADKRPGNEKIIDAIEFSFRTSEQYKADDFALYEDRWQQLARLASQTPEKWEEKPVKTQVDPETYPYPGKEQLTGDTYYEQDLDLYLLEGPGFRSRKRALSHEPLATEPKYLDPQYLPPKAKKLNGNYPITG